MSDVWNRLELSIKDQGGMAFVDCALSLPEAAFFCDMNRRLVIRVDETGYQRRTEMPVSPSQHSSPPSVA